MIRARLPIRIIWYGLFWRMIHAPFLLFLNCTYYNISLQMNLQYEVSEIRGLLHFYPLGVNRLVHAGA
ncbi:hypothetical protein D3C78_854330 [compost metagenome]